MILKTVQQKITVWAGICLFITASVIIIYSSVTLRHEAVLAREDAIVNAKVLSGEVAAKFSGTIKAELEVALDAARTLAQALSGIKDAGHKVELDRDEVNSILRIVLDKNPQFVGTYTCWEPNAFDGVDQDYQNKDGHDATGRFIPYWSRNEAGEIILDPLLDYDKEGPGDYYQLPKKTLNECIIDPYMYPVQGKDTLITSLVVPIVSNKKFYGIAGIDLRLDFLQALADDVEDLYGGAARVALISNNGTLAGVTGKPELVGQHLKQISEDSEQNISTFQKDEKKIDILKGEVRAFIPIQTGRTTTPWCVNINVPLETIAFKADQRLQKALFNIWKMVAIGIVLIAAALVFLWFIARSIANPIKRVVGGLDHSAEQVTSAAVQISSASQSLAEGASEQAASIEETSSSLEEMSSMTRQNADHAAQARGMMEDVHKIVQKVNDHMNDMAEAIGEITSSSEETSKIIKTIDEIAFQTNLLALNAAVEAARAGEAGAGFAVVADEVRSLALRAADAAKNTSVLIEGTINAVKKGNDLTNLTQDAFKENVEISEKIGSLIDEIAAASQEQAQGIEQVNLAVTQMDKVTQQNAANAEESASAAEEMNSQSEQMRDYVGNLVSLVGGGRENTSKKSSKKNRIKSNQARISPPSEFE